MRYIFIILFSILSVSSFAQHGVVTDFKENHETALSLYFYPSTLRMINVERNPEFDDMIKEIKKARFFKLDSGKVTGEDLRALADELADAGFEEIMFIKNKQMDVRVWGLEKGNPQMVIISKSNEELMLLEVDGMINIAKIPKLAETFNQNAFLDVLNLNQKQN